VVTAEAPAIVMPLVKARYELPTLGPDNKPLRYAHLHRRTDLYDLIFNRHCPTVRLEDIPAERRAGIRSDYRDLDGDWHTDRSWDTIATMVRVPGSDPETPRLEPVMVPDPDVIWVGAISNGLVWLKLFQYLRLYNSFMGEVNSGTEGRCEATFYREGQSAVRLGKVIKDNQPGEILNSPETAPSVVDPRAAAEREDMWRESYVADEWDPIVRIDRRFGLHYLKRGDRIVLHFKGWPRPNTPETERVFVLKPPSEGNSFVPAAKESADIVDLASQGRR
jgi:hypothetical protein